MIHIRSMQLLPLAVLSTCVWGWFSSPVLADTVFFEWAIIGNSDNEPDTTGFGSVDYDFWISKHEVTNAQYATFLNAVAATDTHDLYNAEMGIDVRGGIIQSGNNGNFSYSVKPDMGNKPANYVSFFDAMRFINWLENGQPTGAQGPTTTETGVYTIGNGLDEVRQAGATYFVPGENEWYKAAYHKNDGVTGNYWVYPTSSDSTPTIATADEMGNISNPGANVANFSSGADWNGQNGNVTTVGSATSISPYGTYDQGGNVWEWNEAVVVSVFRGLRGGSWSVNEGNMASATSSIFEPANEHSVVGFRVARTPEPATVVVPLSVTATRGLFISGDETSLAASDNLDYQLQRLGTDIQSRTEFEVLGTSPTTNPTLLEVTLEGAVFARSEVIQTIELWDYAASVWEEVDSRAAARFSDASITVAGTGDLSRFVETGTMSIEARIRYFSPNPRQRFSSNTDQFIWTIGE